MLEDNGRTYLKCLKKNKVMPEIYTDLKFHLKLEAKRIIFQAKVERICYQYMYKKKAKE